MIRLGSVFCLRLNCTLTEACDRICEGEMGARMNLLGPLTNPAGAPHRFWVCILPIWLSQLQSVEYPGSKAFVVHGAGGLDELTTTGPNIVSEPRDGEAGSVIHLIQRIWVFRLNTALIYTEEPLRKCRHDKRYPYRKSREAIRRDIVVLEWLQRLWLAERQGICRKGSSWQNESIDSGAVLTALNALIEFTGRYRQ